MIQFPRAGRLVNTQEMARTEAGQFGTMCHHIETQTGAKLDSCTPLLQ